MRRTTLAAAVAVLFAGAAQAAVTELIIYKQPDFRGQSHTIKGIVNSLEGGFAREGSSLIVKGGYWEVCTGDHFKGDCRVLEAGEYPRLGADLNRKIVSVRFLGDDRKLASRVAREYRRDAREEMREARREAREAWREARREDRREAHEDRREAREWNQWAASGVDLYGREDFRGRSIRVDDNVRDLAEHRFDGRASSVIVHEGTWQLCTEPGYRGRCSVLRPGQYPQLAVLDDRVSSMRRLY